MCCCVPTKGRYLNPLDSKGNYSATSNNTKYTGCWWVGCYIWYSKEGTGRGRSPPMWKGFVEKVGFEPGVKEWMSDGWCGQGWERWVDKWMRRWIETRMVRLTKWIWKWIPKTRWCMLTHLSLSCEWAICDKSLLLQ